MRGKPAQRRKQSKTPTLTSLASTQVIITHSLRAYSHENLAWLRKIDKILLKPRNLMTEIHYCEPGEWLERYFKPSEGRRQLLELVQYYKYYKCSPLLADCHHFEFMNGYWNRSKTVYYMKIKRILQIDQEEPEQTLQKNISNEDYSKTDGNKSTFYLMPQLQSYRNIPNDNTLEKILSSMQRNSNQLRGRTIKDIDKAYKFNRDQSKTKDRHSQQKSHLKTNPAHLVSQFSCKPNMKKKKQNHKSLSNQPHSNQKPASKGKKLATTSSCMNIVAHDGNLNYLRRDKNLKHSQKQLKNKKRQASQIGLYESKPFRSQNDSKPIHELKLSNGWNEYKGSHKKAISNERSSQAIQRSKSSKKRLQTQSNVKAAIDKTKNKIKMQKSIMLKKYVQSRQSYTKSIDSTCGQALKHHRK